MDNKLKADFNRLWKKYFQNADLPISYYYTNEEGHAETVNRPDDLTILGRE